ncbi:MAG: FtsW/RodA/SpoVE family cell cycle protein [Bacteroidales bacterium]|nr:FtsW/RodA/SpoVE family cell cycle protein [Bacteroidales bacterium]
MAENRKTGIWNIIDRIEGDKIIWMIVLILIAFSIIAISSSTPLLAKMHHTSRINIIYTQVGIAILGLGVILFFYTFVKKIGVLKWISQLGFFASFLLLTMLVIKIRLPFIRVVDTNDAVRALSVMGFQLHVYEFNKVLMIMYMAWATSAYNSGKLRWADYLAERYNWQFLKNDHWRFLIYIILPAMIITAMTLQGSNSSAMFIFLVMFMTMLLGGIKFKKLLPYGLAGILLGLTLFGLNWVSNGKILPGMRVGTAIERFSLAGQDPEEQLLALDEKSKAFDDLLDKVRQPIAAKVAISEGGVIGKGPGRSTQRYVVPLMFGDYMFSFIVEEFGLVGALVIIILFGSLLARGAILVRNCTNTFAQTAIGGLVVMISGQALMHMMINADLGPLTGQTLPMISHGNSSFLAFSIAFGIILATSRMVKKQMEQYEQQQ